MKLYPMLASGLTPVQLEEAMKSMQQQAVDDRRKDWVGIFQDVMEVLKFAREIRDSQIQQSNDRGEAET